MKIKSQFVRTTSISLTEKDGHMLVNEYEEMKRVMGNDLPMIREIIAELVGRRDFDTRTV